MTGPDVIGLIPAGGRGSRIAPAPCSKELLPIGFTADADGDLHPRVACDYLLDLYRAAGIRNVCFAIRKGKWDIPAYFGDGSDAGVAASYVVTEEDGGVSFTAARASHVLRGALVAFGFPDIILEPRDIFSRLLAEQAKDDADVMLGAFPVAPGQPAEMLQLDEAGRLLDVVVKPSRTSLRYTWVTALWSPRFMTFLQNKTSEVAALGGAQPADRHAELHLGPLYLEAARAGLKVRAVTVDDGWWLDAGTPEGFAAATCRYAEAHKQRPPRP